MIFNNKAISYLFQVNKVTVFTLFVTSLFFSGTALGKDDNTFSEAIEIINDDLRSIVLEDELDTNIEESQVKEIQKIGPPRIESSANLKIAAKFEMAGKFHKGSAPVRVNNKWGLIDTKGVWILAPTFTHIGQYSEEGLLPVKMDDKYGYINHLGTPVTQYVFDKAQPFSEGLAAVKMDEQWGYILPDGKWYITPRFNQAMAFRQGIAPVKLVSGWGYIFSNNKWLILPLYQQTNELSDGFGIVKKDNLLGLVNTKGVEVVKPHYARAKPYSEGTWAVATEAQKWIFIDETGKTVINDVFQQTSSFSEGLVSVKKNDKWGFINKGNKVVIPFKFDKAYDFYEGVAVVVKNGNHFFINKNGRALSEGYEDAHRISEGLAAVKVNNLWGYVSIFTHPGSDSARSDLKK